MTSLGIQVGALEQDLENAKEDLEELKKELENAKTHPELKQTTLDEHGEPKFCVYWTFTPILDESHFPEKRVGVAVEVNVIAVDATHNKEAEAIAEKLKLTYTVYPHEKLRYPFGDAEVWKKEDPYIITEKLIE